MAALAAAMKVFGSAAYKKKEGSLGITKDQKSLIWAPNETGSSFKIPVANITSIATKEPIILSEH
jgi:hypothetical protein